MRGEKGEDPVQLKPLIHGKEWGQSWERNCLMTCAALLVLYERSLWCRNSCVCSLLSYTFGLKLNEKPG